MQRYADLLKLVRAATQCDDVCIVAIFDKRCDFEMIGDVDVMEQALAHIARDLRNQAIVEQWEREANGEA